MLKQKYFLENGINFEKPNMKYIYYLKKYMKMQLIINDLTKMFIMEL